MNGLDIHLITSHSNFVFWVWINISWKQLNDPGTKRNNTNLMSTIYIFFQNQSLFGFDLLLNNEESKKICVVDFSDLSDGRMLDMRPADCKRLLIRGWR